MATQSHPSLAVDVLGELLQGGQVAGLEVVSQGHVQLLLNGAPRAFWRKGGRQAVGALQWWRHGEGHRMAPDKTASHQSRGGSPRSDKSCFLLGS